MVKKILLIFLFFIIFDLKALSLDKIFQANDAASLKSYVKQYEYQTFLKTLCKKQKEHNKPPVACYELSLPVDSSCFSLKLKDLNLKNLNQTLQSNFLSPPCQKHLKQKQKILLYRKKDFLLPELKNYWTVQKPFL